MKPMEMKLKKVEGLLIVRAGKTGEAVATTTRAQLGPGPRIRGLLGPGAQNEVALQDGYSPFDRAETVGEPGDRSFR